MIACMVRKPCGKTEYFLAGEDDHGRPIIPLAWTVIRVLHWTDGEETILGQYSPNPGIPLDEVAGESGSA